MDAKTCMLLLNSEIGEINDLNERNLTRKNKVKIHAFITILHSIISLNIGNANIKIFLLFI